MHITILSDSDALFEKGWGGWVNTEQKRFVKGTLSVSVQNEAKR